MTTRCTSEREIDCYLCILLQAETAFGQHLIGVNACPHGFTIRQSTWPQARRFGPKQHVHMQTGPKGPLLLLQNQGGVSLVAL